MNYAICDVDERITDVTPGSVPTNVPRATRVLVSRADQTNKAGPSPSETKNREGKVMQPQRGLLGRSRLQSATPDQQKIASAKLESSSPDEFMLTTPSMLQSVTDTRGRSDSQNYQQKNEANLLVDREKSSLEASSQIASRNASVAESFKKEQLYSIADPQLTSQSKNPFLSLIFYSKVVYMFSYQFTLQVIM